MHDAFFKFEKFKFMSESSIFFIVSQNNKLNPLEQANNIIFFGPVNCRFLKKLWFY